MSQNNECGCGHPQLTMLPVHGFGLAVDASGLVPAPVPASTGRERVDHDMHIYVNGNLAESGDGLSPETAVKSYEDAVLALSRYDGCNMRVATIHFADLDDPEAAYPDINVYIHSYATFLALGIMGVSHETTMLGRIYNAEGSRLILKNVCIPYVASVGWLCINGKLGFNPGQSGESPLQANWGGHIRFLEGAELFLNPGKYQAVIDSTNGHILIHGPTKFHTLGAVTTEYGFVRARGSASMWIAASVDFSGCSTITGRKYNIVQQACLISGGAVLPGSLPGVTANNGLYL